MRKWVLSLLCLLIANVNIYAQLADDFSDGDFTSNPAWTGDAGDFIVNAAGELQLNAPSVAADSYLSTTSSIMDSTTWKFLVRMDFNTSGSNYAKVYLTSDQSDLTGSLNGYFVQLGGTTMDDVKLVRQAGSATTNLIDGQDNRINSSTVIARIKVFRDQNGLWELFVDNTGAANYVSEGTAIDNTFTTTSYFGVFCDYTSTRSDKFFFDDIIITDAPDTTPPVFQSFSVTGANTIEVKFNEPLAAAQANLVTNYTVNNGIGNPTTAQLDASDPTLVELTFGTNFTPGQTYALTIDNLEDQSGNVMSAPVTVNFGQGATPTAGDLVINEIMADPDPVVGLPSAEYVELLNVSNQLLELQGLSLRDGLVPNQNIGAMTLAPGEAAVFASTSSAPLLSAYNAVGIVSFPSLTNSGKEIFLLNTVGDILDYVNYSDTWYNDVLKSNGGWSLERRDATSPCSSSASNWSASTNAAGGTPGQPNSIAGTFNDPVNPSIVSADIISSNILRIRFDRQMDAASLTNATYTLSNGLTVTSVSVDAIRKRTVDLTIAPSVNIGRSYTVTVAGALSCNGNVVTSGTFTFGEGIKPQFLGLLVTELMFDPTPVVGLPDLEYMEIYNSTDSLIDLNGVNLRVGSSTYVFGQGTLPAGEYAVVSREDNISSLSTYGRTIGLSTFPLLNNTEATVSLYNQNNALVFSVTYNSSWHDSDRKAEGGYSLEMIDVNDPCGTDANWTASNDPKGSTPAQPNSVRASKPDLNDPVVAGAVAINPSRVRLMFNEKLDSTDLMSASITFSDGLTETARAFSTPTGNAVTIDVSPAMVIGRTYTVTAQSFSDCAGNLQSSSSAQFNLPEPAQAGDIILNEILFNPHTAAGDDFVEIYNRSGRHISLKDWKLASGQTDSQTGEIFPANARAICTETCVIGPGEYRTLTGNGKALKSVYTAYREETEITMSLPTYGNTSGTAFLLDSAGQVQDRFTYHDDMHFELIDNTKGFSLERTSFDAPMNDPNYWHSGASTVNGATPGYQNSQFRAGGAISGEIEIDPVSFAPDQDGFSDFTEIKYKFDSPGRVANITVYDSYGREIVQLARNQLLGVEGAIRWDGITDQGTKARVGYYLIHFEVFQTNGDVREFKKTVAVAAKF